MNTTNNNINKKWGEEKEEKFLLKKKIGIFTGISLIVGTMIGSGIFASPTGVLRYVGGSVGLSLVIWTACGFICMLAALCYCELGLSIRESGESNTYLLYGYGKYGKFIAFLHAWSYCLVIKPTAIAALCVAVGEYVARPFYKGCSPPDITVKLFRVAFILAAALSNCLSIKLSRKSQVFTTIGKVLVLCMIVVCGFVEIGARNTVVVENFNNAFDVSKTIPGTVESVGATEICLSLYQGLFPYNGWSSLNFVTEEIRNPGRNLPLAVVIAVPGVMLLYLLVNVAYFSVLTPSDVLVSRAVAETFADRTIPSWSWMIPLGVAISIYGSLNGGFLAHSRMYFVASRRGFFPEIISMANVERFTPSPAVITLCIISLIYLMLGNFDALVTAFSFTSWSFYGLTVGALLIMRKTKPDMERPFKVPILIPVFVVLTSIFFVVAPLAGTPSLVFLFVPCFLLIGTIVYFPFIRYKWRLPGMDNFTIFMQELGNVAPTDLSDLKLEKED